VQFITPQEQKLAKLNTDRPYFNPHPRKEVHPDKLIWSEIMSDTMTSNGIEPLDPFLLPWRRIRPRWVERVTGFRGKTWRELDTMAEEQGKTCWEDIVPPPEAPEEEQTTDDSDEEEWITEDED